MEKLLVGMRFQHGALVLCSCLSAAGLRGLWKMLEGGMQRLLFQDAFARSCFVWRFASSASSASRSYS